MASKRIQKELQVGGNEQLQCSVMMRSGPGAAGLAGRSAGVRVLIAICACDRVVGSAWWAARFPSCWPCVCALLVASVGRRLWGPVLCFWSTFSNMAVSGKLSAEV